MMLHKFLIAHILNGYITACFENLAEFRPLFRGANPKCPSLPHGWAKQVPFCSDGHSPNWMYCDESDWSFPSPTWSFSGPIWTTDSSTKTSPVTTCQSQSRNSINVRVVGSVNNAPCSTQNRGCLPGQAHPPHIRADPSREHR
jgi:hypothetical protein